MTFSAENTEFLYYTLDFVDAKTLLYILFSMYAHILLCSFASKIYIRGQYFEKLSIFWENKSGKWVLFYPFLDSVSIYTIWTSNQAKMVIADTESTWYTNNVSFLYNIPCFQKDRFEMG